MASSPFQLVKPCPGYGEVHVVLLPPSNPALKTLNFTYPLKLIPSAPHALPLPNDATDKPVHPATRPANVPLLFMLSYGGGLLPGDSIELKVTLEASTRLTLATQGSTKVFPCSATPRPEVLHSRKDSESTRLQASQYLKVKLGARAALFLSPDPVQPFRDSHYAQVQIFDLEPGASLGVLDWVSSGRPARGENWDAGSWTGRNEIWRCGSSQGATSSHATAERRLLLRDSMYLEDGPQGVGHLSMRHEGKGVFGTLILLGPLLNDLGVFFTEEFAAQPKIGGFNWDDEDSDDGLRQGDVHPRMQKSDVQNSPRLGQLSLSQWRKYRLHREKSNDVLWTAAKIRGVFIVKVTAGEVEGAKEWLCDMFEREGTVRREFGPGALLSVT